MGGAPGSFASTAERFLLTTCLLAGFDLVHAVTVVGESGAAALRAGPTGPGALSPPVSVPGPSPRRPASCLPAAPARRATGDGRRATGSSVPWLGALRGRRGHLL